MGSFTEAQIKEGVALYLIHVQSKMQRLIAPYKTQRDAFLASEDKLLHDDIRKEYKEIVLTIIAQDVADALKLNPEEVVIAVEDLNFDSYLGE